VCPCQSAECGPVQLFETDKNSKKMKKASTSARADISVRKDEEEEKDLQQKLIGRYINAVSSPMLSKGDRVEVRGETERDTIRCLVRIPTFFALSLSLDLYSPAFVYRSFAMLSE